MTQNNITNHDSFDDSFFEDVHDLGLPIWEYLPRSIEEIIENPIMSNDTKIKYIENITIKYLKENWIFYTIGDVEKYHEHKNNVLFDINSKNFKYHLSHLMKLNSINIYFKFAISAVKTYSYTNWVKTELKRFSHYDEENNSLYIHTNNSIVHIQEDTIKTIKNWNNNILFEVNDNNIEWNFIEGVDMKIDYIKKLIRSMSFKPWILNIDEIEIIIKHYIYSLYFPEIFQSKVIVNVVWDMGAGKSFFFETLLKIFYWRNSKLTPLPKSEKDFYTVLSSNHLVYLDNIDINTNSIRSKLDIIANSATWWTIKWKSIGSNLKQYEMDISANLGFTSMESNINRRDISDRSIIFELERKKRYLSSKIAQSEYVDNRNIILSMLCYELQGVLKKIKDYKSYDTEFRIADFAVFMLNNFKDDKKRINEIFKKIIRTQQIFTHSNEPLPNLIEAILEDKESLIKQWEYYSAKELHIIFSEYSKKHSYLLKYPYKEVKSLAKVMNNNIIPYRNSHNIDINIIKWWQNTRKYSLNLLENNSEKNE